MELLVGNVKIHTSFDSTDLTVDELESSRSKLGVRLIFLVSVLSSLKRESVFRRVPFRDLLAVSLSGTISHRLAARMLIVQYLLTRTSHRWFEPCGCHYFDLYRW